MTPILLLAALAYPADARDLPLPPLEIDGPCPFQITLRYANEAVPLPTLSQWQCTDDALVRLRAQDRTMAWGGAGVGIIGASTASLALMTDTFDSYRSRAIAFGLGLTAAVIGTLFAAVHFGEARRRQRQRRLWADYRP